MIFKRWENYDPSWLINAAESCKEEYPWLIEALKKCTKAKNRNNYYTYFVDESNPNKPGSEWQFQESITIEDTPEGEIVIDIIKTNRVGGIEFLTRVIDDAST
jgi:hypothetical protein